MSFQARVLALVMAMAVVATTATAWFTYHLATAHIAATQSTDQQVVTGITRTLADHAQRHGSWDGLSAVVAALAESTGKRIDVSTESGAPAGDLPPSPRPVGAANLIRVDPRPRLVFTEADAETAAAVTYVQVNTYRTGVRQIGCLGTAGVPATLVPGRNGVPVAQPVAGPGATETLIRCRAAGMSTGPERDEDFAAVNACSTAAQEVSRVSCLQAAFTDRIRAVGPEPVLVAIGPSNADAGLPAGPVFGVVVLVLMAAAVGSALVSRPASRPLVALTRAARRLGAGQRWEPVPVRGDDEVAQLSRALNTMAAALAAGEERQRRMVADVAHELRTPLSTVRSYLEGLIDGVVPPGPELFASLHEEALLQQRIVDDLQDLAQAEAGTLTYRKTVIDVGHLLEACRTAAAVGAEHAHIRLSVHVSTQAEVYGDPDRLRQVVGNLVANAVRYTPAGGSITLSGGVSGDMVVIGVTDTGCGIAAADLPHVFDRFWRADASRGRTTGGSGLGLAIARQIVTDHGGAMAVRSTPGSGTTFTVRLPPAERI